MMNRLQFYVRKNLIGKVALRRGLPAPRETAIETGERDFYKLVLKRAARGANANFAEARHVIDVGCRNWSYARALAEYFPKASLTGVEVDGGRRYWNLHRRQDVAQAYAVELVREGRAVQCRFDDFRDVPVREIVGKDGGVVFCLFFPFVSEHPCMRWGLPVEFADFASLLSHAVTESHAAGAATLASSTIVSAHQGQWEGELALAAYEQAGLVPTETVIRAPEFAGLWPSSHDVHVLFARIPKLG